MRVALVYDCLYPQTIGGAERWYCNLAERLGEEHRVTYLTRRQWGEEGPGTPFEALAVSPGGDLYTAAGRRRIGPPLRFGWGVFVHLLRHADRYDAVHTASFPYFSVLAAAAALRLRRSRAELIVDWHELWTAAYWRSYLGPLGGRAGHAVQALCVRLADRGFCFSRLVEARLRAAGHSGPLVRLDGEYAGPERGAGEGSGPPDPPLVVFAGRHVPEKRVTAIPPAIALARRELPGLRCEVFGEGPRTAELRRLVAELELEGTVAVRGRAGADEVLAAIASASCLLNPSEREGYGLVVVEAVAQGTPAIVVAGPENAAVELIEQGVNGYVATGPAPAELGRAIVEVVRRGEALRRSTREWYARNRERLSLVRSLDAVISAYAKKSP